MDRLFSVNIRQFFLLFVLIVTFQTSAQGDDNLSWTELMPGLDRLMIEKTNPFPGSIKCQIFRLHPDKWEFSPCSHKVSDSGNKQSARGWLQDSKTHLVITAGQYDTDFNHLGWLLRNGKNLGSGLHSSWKGLFVSRPVSSSGKAMTILDIQDEQPSLASFQYKSAVQSIMLFDETGKIRVLKSSRTARRCVVGLGYDQLIYLIVTESEITLYNLAEKLKSGPVKLRRAMIMDGGSQAQISVSVPGFELDMPGFQIPIPSAICFYKIPVENE